MDSDKKQKKRKPALVFPFVLLAVLVAGIITASILVRPHGTEKPRQREPLALQVDALIVGLLQEEDWVDRNHLITRLRSVTGMYFDYHPEATEERRREALDRWNDWWNSVKLKYGDREPERIDWLLDALADSKYRWRHVIIPEVGGSKDPRAMGPLTEALRENADNPPRVRLEAAKALGTMDNSAALPALLMAMRDSDIKVGLAAAESMAILKSKKHSGQIVGESLRSDLDLRLRFELAMAALQSLGEDKTQAEPAFIAYCRDAATDHHSEADLAQAVQALAVCGTEACLEVLEILVVHRNPAVRDRAVRVREKIRKKSREGAPR